jgi:hypothetical protein
MRPDHTIRGSTRDTRFNTGPQEKTAAALPGDATAFKNRQGDRNSDSGDAARAAQKGEATMFAAYALRGFSVHKVPDGYLVSRWGLTRHCPDLQTLTAFANQVGVPL